MATFKVGDWVEVTPNSDTKSEIWDVNVHTHFCGKIGEVTDISEDDEGSVYRVQIYFDSHKPFGQPGNYSAWFEDKHIIKSSQYNFRIKYELKKDFEEYMRIERKMKTLRDKYLKEVFTDPYEEERRLARKKEQEKKPRPLPDNVRREIEEADWSQYDTSYYYTDDD